MVLLLQDKEFTHDIFSLLYKVNLEPWNKGRIIGQKPPLKLKEIWAIRIRLQLAGEIRNLALFNLAIDSKLRACDLVRLRVCDVTQGYKVVQRAIVMQRKTKRPVQFEITDQTQLAIRKLITKFGLTPNQFFFPSRLSSSPHLSRTGSDPISGMSAFGCDLNQSMQHIG